MAYQSSELNELYAKLTIEDEEEIGVIVGKAQVQQSKESFVLIGRFLMEKNLNFNAMQTVLSSIWRPKEDMQKVTEGGPWSFEQGMLVFKQLTGGEDPKEITLNEVDIWIQVYDLPKGFLSEDILQSIANFIGVFVKSDPANLNGVWKSYYRIRVRMNVSKPLKRRMKIKREDGDWSWINFKYERLSTFCFVCGKIGHSERDCSVIYANPGKEIERVYGTWLRAPNKNSKPSTVSRWLRNAGDGSKWAEHGGSSKTPAAGFGNGDDDASFKEKDNYDAQNQGAVGRITVTARNQEKKDIGGNYLNEIITQKESNVEVYHIIDPKRRRTEEETVLKETGPTSMQTDGPTHTGELENAADPKNLNMASIQGGCSPFIMSILSWNCHGLGTPWAFQFLKEIILQKRPDFVFLCEILCKQATIEKFQNAIAFEGMVVVETQGHSGGVALLWRHKEDVTLRSYNKNHIDADVKNKEGDNFRLTSIYGEPDRRRRKETWDLMRTLSINNVLPWCLIGDMNNVVSQLDKQGGRPYPQQLIQGFNDVIEDCHLMDMELIGYPFTWERGVGTSELIEVRLDRALISVDFLHIFKDARLLNLEVSTSDHCPILLELHKANIVVQVKRFRFENVWLREPMCQQLVEEVWNNSSNESFYRKLEECSEILSKWGKEITGSFKNRINHCKKEIKRLKGRRDSISMEVLQKEQKNLSEIYAQQEIFWRQRSKQLWLREGDQNSRFFHASVKNRRASNQIKSLKNGEGQLVEWNSGLENVMTDYFSSLFKASDIEWHEVVQCIDKRVCDAQNAMLLSSVEEDEVKEALFHMHPDKSPGPDGMTPGFYQKFWPLLGGEVVNIVQQFFEHGRVDSQLICTNIALIPKKRNPQLMTDLRPISLCNVIYKVISKVLANRVKKVIDLIISDTQSAFIPGRLITDNIMIAHELMHFMKRKTTGKQGWMALKVDMSKAYDRVEWGFLEAVLSKMGFAQKVIELFMACISSVTYQISHAGRVFGSIVPSRGIRQGDPLSSYLFLMCIEGLTALIKNFERRGLVHGIKVSRSAPPISHMFFADDCYIFCKASVECATQALTMLNIFEKASGQQVNVDKSSVLFSKNVNSGLKQELCHQLGFMEAGDNSTYLGLPSLLNRNKSVAFGFIKEKLQERLQGWDKKKLSKGGKEILLKTVAQALPNYTMSVFLLPIEVCKELERTMCKFWWKSDASKEKCIHWMSWDIMSERKVKGGMGFRSLRDFNIALVGKQAWRLLTNPEKLVSQVFKARYFPSETFLTAKMGSNPSYIWRSVLEAQGLIKQGSSCRVGNGQSLFIMNVPWLPDTNNPYVQSDSEALINQKVSSLMITGEKQWDNEVIMDLFTDRDANLILSIPLGEDDNDNWYWKSEKMGAYSVKSAYLLLQDSGRRNPGNDNSGFWRKLWNLKIPSKVKNFLWRAANNCLPTKDLLRSKRVPVNNVCPSCHEAPESILHTLVTCPFAQSCWHNAALPMITSEFHSFPEWLQLVFTHRNTAATNVTVMVCWMIWKNRNDLVWNQKCLEVKEVLATATSVLNQWRFVQDKSFDNSLGFMNQEDGREQWQVPMLNRVKVNTDAAIFNDLHRFSHAVVVRDHNGNLIEAKSKCFQGTVSPDLAEAMGIREALSWVKNSKQRNVVVETDCLKIVQWIRSSFVALSYLGRVVEECRSLLSGLQAQNVMLRFVKRSANSVAHYLARYSSSLAERSWKMKNVHPDFYAVLCHDLNQ